MCIETQSLGTALLPKFAFDLGYDATLLQLISAYQKNPGTETYQAVQKFLVNKRNENLKTMYKINKGELYVVQLNILDYEDNLLWSTARLQIQDKIVLLFQASEYSSQSTQGSSYKKFEDGTDMSLSWVSGGPVFAKGGALKFGATGSDNNQPNSANNASNTSNTANPDSISYNNKFRCPYGTDGFGCGYVPNGYCCSYGTCGTAEGDANNMCFSGSCNNYTCSE